jgi:hypothetical protein
MKSRKFVNLEIAVKVGHQENSENPSLEVSLAKEEKVENRKNLSPRHKMDFMRKKRTKIQFLRRCNPIKNPENIVEMLL